MIEFIIELIPPRLLGFMIGVVFIAGGVWVWQTGSAERALYDNATGAGSKSYMAEIRYKTTRSVSTSGINDHDYGTTQADFLDFSYTDESGDYKSASVMVDKDEFDKVKVGDKMKISFHPGLPEHVITPAMQRPGVFWYRIGAILMMIIGAFTVLAIIISLF